jgi:methylenetetrahydrofolate dehydrogenase (NADP+) / methenyltetrahydrofolate cyclohydrolase
MQLIDGKLVSAQVRKEIAEEVKKIVSSGKRPPHLAAVLVGNDGGSETYVANKIKACEEVGFTSTLVRFTSDISETELLNKVIELNNDPEIDGFIVQLPLPKHISEEKVTETISPLKDVDGFHPQNIGRLTLGMDTFVSATPQGMLELLKYYKIDTNGKHCVVIGRSNIVGRPMSILLSQKRNPGNATVTVLHSRSENLKEICRQADIIVAAVGVPEFVTADMVKEGAVVLDVGTTRVPSTETKTGYKLKGDVKFDEVASRCSYITPVPGGVGPMTITSLMINTLKASKLHG